MTGGPADPQETGASASDPLPPEALAAAKDAFTTRTEGEVAELVFDSLLDGTGTPADHELRFERLGLSICVEVTDGRGVVSVVAEVMGSQPHQVLLQSSGEAVAVAGTARGGRFRFEQVGRGQLRLRLDYGSDHVPVWTDWFLV